MKKILLCTTLLFAGGQYIQAQAIPQTVSVGAGYAEDTWYSLENGEQGTKSATEWDLSFSLSAIGTSIRVNSANGIALYSYPDGDINDWANVDVTNMGSWSEEYNSAESWSLGAFDNNVDPSVAYDVGWGIYDYEDHVIYGDSIFVLRLIDDSYRKLRIDKMESGVFHFTYANIDGTNEIQDSVVKADYADKLFGYYSIQNQIAVDHEPVITDEWDLLFGRYTGFIPTPYNLTGIIAGPNTEVVRIEDVSDVPNYNDWSAETFTYDKSTIGADWKGYDFSTGWYILDDRVYFVKTKAGDVWKIIPTGFGGMSNGNFEFTKEKLSAMSTDDYGIPAADVVVYPNPATNNVSLILNNMISNTTNVQIMNLEGQIMFEQVFVGESNFDVKNIPVHSYGAGVYIVNVQSANQVFNQKLVIK